METQARIQLFARRRIALPPEFIPLLEPAIQTGVMARSVLDAHFPNRNGRDSSARKRFLVLVQSFDITISRDTNVAPVESGRLPIHRPVLQTAKQRQSERLRLAVSTARKDDGDGRRSLQGVSACLATIGGSNYPTKAEHLAMAREMEGLQRAVLDILLTFPPLAQELDARLRANLIGYQPKANGQRLGASIKRRKRYEWWPYALKQLKRLYELGEQYAELDRQMRAGGARERRNFRRQLRRFEKNLGGDGQGLATALQAINQPLRRYKSLRDEMIVRNIRLTISIAKRFTWAWLDFEDLISEGNDGLRIAVDRYDWRKGYNLSVYATWWIRQAITRAIADQARTVRLPVYQVTAINRLNRVRRNLDGQLGRYATDEEVATALETSVEDLEDLIRYGQSPISLDHPINENDETPLVDTVLDPRATDPNILVNNWRLREALERSIGDLKVREARVIRLRFGLTEDGIPRTLEEVGAIFNVTRERIRQIEAKALRKLRHPNRSRRLEGFREVVESVCSSTDSSVRPVP